MRRWVWLVPLVTGLLLAGCGRAAPPGSGNPRADSAAVQRLQTQNAPPEQPAGPGSTAVTGKAAVSDSGLHTGSVPLDPALLKDAQAAADAGRRPSNLEPVATVLAAAADLGIDLKQDQVKLDYLVAAGAGSGTGEAYVDVLHAGREYVVQVIQPVRSGPGGIWAVNSVQDVGLARDNAARLDTVRRYFEALAARDYETAYGLLARRFRQGTSPAALAGNNIARLAGVERTTWNSPSTDTLVLNIKLSLDSAGSIWNSGSNVRFVRFVAEDGRWKIAAFATSP